MNENNSLTYIILSSIGRNDFEHNDNFNSNNDNVFFFF